MQTKALVRWGLLLLFAATPALAQDPASSQGQQGAPPPGAGRMIQGPGDGRGQPVFGKIAAIKDGALDITKPDGSTATVKINGKTEFRKDRQNAKLGDFKVGDMVFVRAEDTEGQGLTALMVAGRTGGIGGQGMGGLGGNMMMMMGGGEMGKDFVVGEVTAIDAPQITIQRPDNVTQKLELTEDTSLRKGRDSVTMADIQVGDHVFVRGALQNNAFVPKNVRVIPAEQWKRMQDMGMITSGSKPPAD